jgi:cholesterol oxidase
VSTRKKDNSGDLGIKRKPEDGLLPRLQRRQFLAMFGATAAASAWGGSARGDEGGFGGRGKDCGQDPNDTDAQALIIGSGFGGSVAALRLGQAGIKTIVLERGKRWAPVPGTDTFARTPTDGRTTFLGDTCALPFGPPIPVPRYLGVTQELVYPNLNVFVGAGVGGGSLVYGTTTIAPDRSLFNKLFPRSVDFDELNEKYYPRVRRMLNATPIPSDIYNSTSWLYARVFADQATAAGFAPHSIAAATDWNVARLEYAGLLPQELTSGATAAGGGFGSNNGAKFSLDRNYLPAAEATGHVQIMSQHSVTNIRRNRGRFEVSVEVLDLDGTVLQTKTFTSRYLFLAAGSIGTTRLLLRAKATGGLSSLHRSLGNGFGTNGKILFIRLLPTLTGVDQGFTPANSFSYFDNPDAPSAVESAPSAIAAQVPVSLMGTSLALVPERAAIRYDSSAGDVVVDWAANGNQTAVNAAVSTANRLNAANPGSATFTQPVLGPDGLSSGLTYHPLGGAVVGDTTDPYGRVKGEDNLYVMDGALMPGSCACVNPSFTIAALAERNIERIIREDLD